MDYGTLRVTTPDGQVREYPIEVASVVVGRADGNGVTIDHVSVSRRHAQLQLSEEGLSVEDLGSANGTFIGSQRLAANTLTKVEGGQAIRFGDVEAHFLSPNEARDTRVAAGGGAAAEGQGTIAVSLASPASPVAVGQATTATVVVQNRGTSVDEITLSVIDLPANWVRISRPTLSLVAGARDEITIVIQPPRSPESVAGEHPFSVSVVSGDTGREVRVLGTCTILPFDNFSSSMQASGKDYKVTIENQGNSTMTYALSVTSTDDKVNTKLDRESVELGPGASTTVPLSVSSKRPWFGAAQMRQFRVHVKPVRGANPEQTADGQIVVRPPFRQWRIPVTAMAALALLGVGGFAYVQAPCRTVIGCASKAKTDFSKTPVAGGTPTSPAAAASTPTPAGLRNGVTAVVVNSAAPNNCLNVRAFHTRVATDPQSKSLGTICDGTKVKIVSDSVETEGFVWWTIDTGTGLTGWAAEKATTGGDSWLVLSQ